VEPSTRFASALADAARDSDFGDVQVVECVGEHGSGIVRVVLTPGDLDFEPIGYGTSVAGGTPNPSSGRRSENGSPP
jgi:hypothetical protein